MTFLRPSTLAAAILVMAAVRPAFADPVFSLPLACTLGTDCFVQNYVDTDAGPGAADFTCGGLTYDGHKGTDIRLKDYVAMAEGVDVLAAAAGTVLRLRDGMDDVNVREIGVAAIKDRMAGNSVIVDHGDGWVTQYAHMKKGSIAVTPGQKIAAGDKLGQVGLSGNTEFPHLHFEIRHGDKPVDPFTDEEMGAGCDVAKRALWQPALSYQAGGVLSLGLATAKPDPEAARHGAYGQVAPGAESDALVFWVDLFGLRANDRLVQQLIGPDGTVIAAIDEVAPKSKAQFFSFVGKKKPLGGWPSGSYQGVIRLLRDGATLVDQALPIAVP
ncbi:M23 family metallopeptidase [Dongia rigui]|uniref:M23 family metallopeptidase n=1 Tax=Dongia rigui TaxID=940149 RepID=A0ABU5E2K5_9PROT|nr:M23 family metallopeptidase [Dongia rigui]MDY0873791.1 M23 family metallopeptidase [Dongia rigui]